MGIFLFGTDLSDNLAGGDGDDQIFGQGGNDTLSGNAGADTLDGGLGNDQLRGGQGNDFLLGNDGNDNLDGEAGDDILDGGAGTDIYRFGRGDGHDVITGFQLSQDLMLFDSGILLSDVRATRENDDLLLTIKDSGDSARVSGWFSFAGNQLLRINFADGTSWKPAAIDFLVTSSNDVISGTGSSETLDGGPGDDWLFGFAGNDVLYGDAGNDTLDGGDGADTYLFGRGDGQDLVSPSTSTFAADKLQFGSGITVADVAVSQVADDLVLTIKGSTDSVRISEYFINGNWGGQIRFVDGTSWDVATILSHLTPTDNMIGGTPGNDFLDGGAGNDFLYGDAGNDTLYGGSGSDGLDGGPGADTYLFGRDDGEDWINSIAPLSEDRLQFGGSISFTDVEATVINASLSGNDLLLTLKGSADKVHVPGYFWGGASQLGEIRFADGTIWDASVINRKVFLSNDALYGTSGADLLDGGLGNDTLSAAEGDDVLYGDSGDDRMEGGPGSDRYYFGRASGHDTIVEQVQAPGDTDSVVFSRDVAVQDLVVTRDLDDLVVGVYGSAAQLRVSAWFQPFTASHVERFVFSDGTVLSDQNMEAMLDNAPIVANPLADQSAMENAAFSFTVPADTFADPDVGDVLTLSARLANGDPLPAWLAFDPASGTFGGTAPLGSAGTVSVQVFAADRGGLSTSDQFDIAIQASSIIAGTEGDDFLFATDAGNEMLGFGGNDQLFGGMGNDTLDGGTGNDFLSGGGGDDVYVVGSGFGESDQIFEAGGTDQLRFAAGISPDQVERVREDWNSDLVLRVMGTGNEVRIANWAIDPSYQVEQVVFADGTVWDAATTSTPRRVGTQFGDFLMNNSSIGGVLEGRGGNDQLSGGMGNDTLDGGTDNDFLAGGGGDDVYLVGSGSDQIFEAGGTDQLRFAAGISPDQVERVRDDWNSDLVLRVMGTGNEVRIWNGAVDPYQVEQVVFDDGTVWDAATTSTPRRIGTEFGDFLQGSSYTGGILEGRGGNDQLSGGMGNDTLDGGTGNDFLAGGGGDDVYLVGSGSDQIFEGGGTDQLRFAAGISPDQVERVRDDWNSDLVLRVMGTGNEVRISNGAVDPSYQVEQVVFADGTVWDAATTAAPRRIGTEFGDFLQGSSYTGGVLEGRGGDDQLMGGMGNDTLDGGTGNDSLFGGWGDDVYLVGSGSDQIFEGGGTDQLRFAAGISPDQVERVRDDWNSDLVLRVMGTGNEVRIANWAIDPSYQVEQVVFADGTVWDAATTSAPRRIGTEFGDFLMGSSSIGGVLEGRGGNDQLMGGMGNDTLDGGTGNDFLSGGGGDDVYLVGSGFDQIYEVGGTDQLRFAAGISPDQVERVHDDWSSDLVLRVAGTGDEVRIGNWFIDAPYQVEQVVFADGTVWDAATTSTPRRIGTEFGDFLQGSSFNGGILEGRGGDDQLLGGMGNDTLDGGTGNDFLDGQNGADTYIFGRGDGHDVIWNGLYWNNVSLAQDVLQFAPGITLADVGVSREFDDLVLAIKGTSDSVRVSSYFRDPASRLGEIRFADGASWDAAAIERKLTAMSDFLAGTAAAETLDGGPGDDYMIGYGGDDFLYGDAGNDWIMGLAGNDTYYFGFGSGHDTIWDGNTDLTAGFDVVRLDSRVMPGDIEFRVNGTDLSLKLAGSDDELLLWRFLDDTVTDSIDAIYFGDGTPLGLLRGTNGDDFMTGSQGTDVFLSGFGTDTMSGGAGNDIYVTDFGSNTIFDAADATGGNQLTFGGWTMPGEPRLSYENGFLVISSGMGSARLSGFDHRDVLGARAVQSYAFADGTVLSYEDFVSRGFYIFATGVVSQDFVEGTSIQDRIYGSDQGELLSGLQGDDALYGGGGDDTLHGDEGTDYAGNDTLDGGAGDDSLLGWKGSDTYFFDRASGNDRIYELQENPGDVDTLIFGDNITRQDLVVTPDAFGNLRIDLSGSPASVTFNQWFNPDIPSHVERFVFRDGTVLSDQQIEAMINRAPVANPDAVGVDEDATTANLVPLLLANDTDADAGDTLSVSAVDTTGTIGTVAFDAATQALTYSADAASQDALATGETATDSFSYAVADSQGKTSTAAVTVTVTGVNDAPVAIGESFTIGASFPPTLSGTVLANDSDPDNGAIIRVANGGIFGLTFGTLVLAGKGLYTYRADKQLAVLSLAQGQIGIEQFTYTVTDDTSNPSDALTATAQFTVQIVGVNDAPIAFEDFGAVQEDTVLTASGNVLANDTDYDQGTVLSVANPGTYTTSLGTLVLGADGSYTYTLANGSDAVQSLLQGDFVRELFDYTVSDGITTSGGQIEIDVTGANDAPVAVADSVAVAEDATTADLVPLLMANDTDADHDLQRITTVNTAGTVGTVSFNASTQTLTYAADAAVQDALAAGQTATDHFTYTVSDLFGGTSSATVAVTVTGVNDAPVLGTPLADQTAAENQLFTFQLPAGTFTDVDSGDTLSFAVADGSPLPSWLSFDAANLTFTGTPGHADIGTGSIKVVATDAHGLSASDVFAITTVQTVFNGTSGADNLVGSAFNDTLSGLGGNDVLDGGTGNDTLDGGAGRDTMTGGTGDDTYVVSVATDVVTENPGEGNDTVQSAVTLTLGANVENLILTGSSSISGTGNALNNLVRGNSASNTLNGADGFDALEGGAGNDALNDTSGGNYYNGGAGTDTLTGGTSGDFFMGGTGNDTISTGNGPDVIAFNVGDGQDKVNPSSGVDDTLSLGGAGLNYANLTFQRSANNLILNVSATDKITFTNWYAASANKNVLDLQVVAEAMAGFNPAGGNALLDNKVENFNFQGLVGAFDAARAVNPTLTTWALTNALTQFQLAGSDTAALGGDLAYQYGLNGTVAGIGFDKAQDVVTGTGFGTQAQTLRPLASLQDGVTPLT